ncbi:hypothetical protein [Domibacillus mangrovi]|uniref:Uncharacterized protein n=1 Tax=Domibacillus mangrovi TaxID=1714354 RepID=A0A1Q5P3V6_9BACI|nr:hypothetical protein [Domibacillus mangrovi]OKL36927.1 hypothetical protein BLL40_09460 [Domibacillus mangrovi]
MIKKHNAVTIYLTASLLLAIIFFTVLLNQFLTKGPVPTEVKQPVTTEQKEAVPEEAKKPASQTQKESEIESEEKNETDENQDGYVADWFKQSDSLEIEEVPASSENDMPNQEETKKTIENQSKKEVIKEQPVEAPIPPTQPEQPSFSSGK